LFEPDVKFIKATKGGNLMPKPVSRITNILLDLAFFPARRWITKFRGEHKMSHHDLKPGIDRPLLSAAHFINRGFHIIVDTALGNTTQHPEGMIMRIEQHLMGLQQFLDFWGHNTD